MQMHSLTKKTLSTCAFSKENVFSLRLNKINLDLDRDIHNPSFNPLVYSFLYVSQCSKYQDFIERGKVLTTRLLSQEYQTKLVIMLVKKVLWGHQDLGIPYNMTVSRIISDVFAHG